MNGRKAILLTMAVLIMSVSLPGSEVSAHMAERHRDVVAAPASTVAAGVTKAHGDAVPAPFSQIFQRPGFYAPNATSTCVWVAPKVLYCDYPGFYCYTFYRYSPPRTSCYNNDSGW